MLANFNGVGPWRVRLNQTSWRLDLEPNPGAWNRRFGVVFFDNPIGTGFSVASTPEEIPRDQHTIAKHLFTAIKAFMELNPSFQCRPLYLAGEGYAGKYVVALGYYIAMNQNPYLPEDEKINLVGLSVGNGLIEPVKQVTSHAENAYFVGLIDEGQRLKLRRAQKAVVRLISRDRWEQATTARKVVLSMLENMTGLATLLDVSRKTPYNELTLTEKLLETSEARGALGVVDETATFEVCNAAVEEALHEDGMKSVREMVEYLLETESCKVLLYEGQRDLRDGVVSVESWLRGLKWREGIRGFRGTESKVWRVKGELAGYVHKWGPLSHVVVLGAGHFVAVDQPKNAQSMMEDWVLERGLFAPVQDNTRVDQVQTTVHTHGGLCSKLDGHDESF